jgi:hypothetical protein
MRGGIPMRGDPMRGESPRGEDDELVSGCE